MTAASARLLYWAPRILCIAFAAFLSIFALDVFTGPMSPGQRAIALAMHLIPTFVVLAALAVVWRWEWIGGVLFPGLAVFHLVSMWHRHMGWSGYVVIELPLVVLGVLFWMNWRRRLAVSGSRA